MLPPAMLRSLVLLAVVGALLLWLFAPAWVQAVPPWLWLLFAALSALLLLRRVIRTVRNLIADMTD